ncbi:MAG: 3-dehydroquinate synthase [Candidatus Obscuribacterales bacterium]|nr:3-dehydroquinate synthase [Candidatus Obscuribacterales bacterium]
MHKCKRGCKHGQELTMLWQVSNESRTRFDIGFGAFGKVQNILGQISSGKRVMIISQRSVTEHWLPEVSEVFDTDKHEIVDINVPEGEECKSVDWLMKIWRRLQEHHFDRHDTIVAVGGGAVTDLAGFAAATYLRGINLVLVPTTLLAQVDAAIGGKTGINLPAGKNLAGSFYFPQATIVDPQFLSTLTKEQFNSGMAEIIKYALLEKTIADETEYKPGPRPLLEILESNMEEIMHADPDKSELLAGIITSSVRMKLSVVGKDTREGNLRRCLNLGHTLGHGIEKAMDYSLPHGNAVSIGMVFACEVAVREKLLDRKSAERVTKLLTKAHLPTEIPVDIDKRVIVEAMTQDKKRQGNVIKFVLPNKKLGSVDYSYEVKLDNLEDLL